jgi:nicotinate-nucleotide--dimethylbenzimidazole phosphoribosyltransferase
MQEWTRRADAIRDLDKSWREKARKRLAEQTRPQGSLGVLEEVVEWLVAIQEKERPSVTRKRILIFAADHGVEEEKVSLYPKSVTQAMVYNFLNGGATINSRARSVGAEVEIIDVGVDADFENAPGLVHAKIRRGTRNMTREPAMTKEELAQALEAGWARVERAKQDGVELLGLGEMGIANTTAASAVIAALTGRKPETVTGRGTGLDDEAMKHKIEIVRQSLEQQRPFLTNPFSILQCVGGYEIAALAGAIFAAGHFRLPVVIDGWIVAAAALVGIRLNPHILSYLFFSHQSEEIGHRLILEELDAHPLLNLKMRLGEASGAALAMSILDAAVRIYHEVATFQEARVAQAIA